MVGEAPLYPQSLSTFSSVEIMVMNNRASFVFGDSKMIRHNDVDILEVHQTTAKLVHEHTHLYMFTCLFPASQSSIEPLPSRLATAEASWLLESRISPWCKDLVTKSFPNTLTMKFFSLFSQLSETVIPDWGCSWRKRGRRSRIRCPTSAPIVE